MKITIVIDAPEYIGGVRYIERFIKILNKTEVDIQLTVIYINCEKSIDIQIQNKKEFFLNIPKTLYKIDRAIARFTSFSIFSFYILKYIKNSNLFFSDVFLPAFIRKKNNVKVVAWFPDFQVFDLPHFFTAINIISRKLYINLQLRTCDFLLTQSETDKIRMITLFPKYANKIVKWSFAEPYLPINEVDVIKVNGFEIKRKKYLLYPHQGWAHKNHLLLINLLQSFPGEILVLTGRLSDPRNLNYSQELSEAISKSGVKIICLGLVNNDDLNLLMKNAKAILNLSSYEGWSSCVEEGIMMNTALVLSNIPIHIEQFPNAFFVDITSPEKSKKFLFEALNKIEAPIIFDYDKRLNQSVSDLNAILTIL